MDAFIGWLNSTGDTFVAWAVRMLVQSSVLILALVVLDLLLRRRVKAVIRYWIWLLVLVKLVLPPSLSSPTGLAYWIGDKLPGLPARVEFIAHEPPRVPPPVVDAVEQSAPRRLSDFDSSAVYTPYEPGPAVGTVSAVPLPSLTWQAGVLVAWTAVVLVMIMLLIQRAFLVRGLVAQSREVPEPLVELQGWCRRRMGIRANVAIRRSDLSLSPSVCGLWRPIILLPQAMLDQLNTAQWKSILLHELAHIRRGDLWVNLVQTLLQITCFFHPLLWIANAIIRRVREQAVDETVLAVMGEEAEEYPRTLLSVSRLAFGRPVLSLRLLGVVESKKALATRVKRIASRPFPTSAKLGLLGLALILAVAAVLLPMAGRTQASAGMASDERVDPQYKAMLTSGLTVELLGVCEHPTAEKAWWNPDGTAMTRERPGEFAFSDPDYHDPDAHAKVVALRLTGRPLNDVALAWHIEASRLSTFVPRYEDRADKLLQPIQTIVAAFADDPAVTDLKIGIAAGPWRFAAGGALPDRGASTNDSIVDRDVIWPEPVWRDGSVRVQATHLLGRDYDCRIIAHGTDGRMYEPQACTNTGGTDLRLCEARFSLAKDQIKQFALQARPYEWVEFRGIRLMPQRPDNDRADKQLSKTSLTQIAAPPSQAAPPAGVVVNDEGRPVPGARIVLYFRNNSWGLGNCVVEETHADTQGRFALTTPLMYRNSNGTTYTDHYLLFAVHPDHALAWQVIVSGAENSEYTFNLTKPATQAFRVTDREGKPLPKARVWICGAGRNDDPNPLLRPSFGIREDIDLLAATTDEQGRAVVTNLPRTRCSFKASMPGYSHRSISLGVPAQGETHVEMTRAATVTGRVLTGDGKPVVNAQIWFQADWGEWYFDYAITDETGHFINDKMVARGGSWVSGGGSGQYKVTIRHPDFTAPELVIQLEPGKTDTFDIDAVEGTLLRVHALEPETERPIPGARIYGSSASGRLDGYTDANGVFERRVLNGDASAGFGSPPGGTYIVEDVGRSTRVRANGGLEEVTVYAASRLHPLVDIKGRLLLPDSSSAAGVKISTTNNISRYHTATFGGTGGAYARTDPDGSFELMDVPRDVEVFLYGHTSDNKYVLAEVLDPAQASPELARPLVMQEGRSASVILTDESGKPRVNMALKLRPRKWDHYVFRADDRPAATDAEGRLSLDGIVPGLEYFIRDARADLGESGWWNLYNEDRVLLASDDGPSAPAAASPATPGVGATISGVVMDTDGAPIADAHVSIRNMDLLLLPEPVKFGAQMRRVMRPDGTRTDAEGHFRFTDLAPGKTTLSVAAPGHRTEFLQGVSTGTEGLRIVLGEPRPYQLAGVVVDESCQVVADVEITFIEEILSGPGRENDGPPLIMRTDKAGTFRLDRTLSPVDGESVRRLLYAHKQGYGAWGTQLDTTGGQTFLRIALSPEEMVSGVVKDEAGAPVTGATVILYSGWGRLGAFWFAPAWQHLAPQATTEPDGSFTLEQLPTESDLFLQVQSEGYASGALHPVRTGQFGSYAIRRGDRTDVMGGTSDPNAPLVITLHRAVTLRGTVVYEGSGEPAAAIRLFAQSLQDGAGSEAVTDTAGRFEMNGVSPTPCNLLVRTDNPARDAMPERTAAALRLDDLEPGETRDGLRLVLTKGDIIRGRVTDAQGHPLKGIDIAFYSAARPRSGAACQSIHTAADGTWAYRFPPGEVYVYIRTDLPDASWQRKSYTYNLAAGATIEGVDFVLSQVVPENSQYRGVAVDAGVPGDRRTLLPPGATAGAVTEWPVPAGGNGHLYLAVRMPKPLPWQEAHQIAGTLGGHLVTITSEVENDFVFRLIDDDTYWFHSYNWRGPWLGAVQPPGSDEPAGGWSWVTGEPFGYAKWDAQQPNNFNGSPEDRLVFGNQRSRIPTWNDVTEDFPEVVSFVVEWEAPQSAVKEWPVAAGGNGHSYRVVRVPEGLTWDQANEAAQGQGGYLATITSAEENAFVFSLIQDPVYWNDMRGPWIGGYQPPGRTMKAGWTWVTGEPFSYSNWSINQPNDGGAADETRLHYGWGITPIADTWNDQPDWYRGVHAYVVETDHSGHTPAVKPSVAARIARTTD